MKQTNTFMHRSRACNFGSRRLCSVLMAGLSCVLMFLVADDDHKPKTCVNMSIGMKHIVCIYCLLAFLKAQNNRYHSPFTANAL